MFPYPGGALHMGQAETYLYSDIVARAWRHRGYNVLNPIGWDSFGLPAENAAIMRGADPQEWTFWNIEQQKDGFRSYGMSFESRKPEHPQTPMNLHEPRREPSQINRIVTSHPRLSSSTRGSNPSVSAEKNLIRG
jgi:leucyl-tRNA synthetase